MLIYYIKLYICRVKEIIRNNIMKPTLLILAAGMGSRYGALKQMDGIGPNGEAIIDYSIYDAIRAGFGKIVFVIRHSFADSFQEHFKAEKFDGDVEFKFVYQELDCLPEGYSVPEGREKPWGTNHAIMMGADVINEPFAVINADDYYGPDSFRACAEFLKSAEGKQGTYALISYHLKNTLSEFGKVSRGVCTVDDRGYLDKIVERTKIGVEDDRLVYEDATGMHDVDPESYVSMNFWAFTPEYFDHSKRLFSTFLDANMGNLKSEFFIPSVVDTLVREGKATVKVVDCSAKWFGVTYKEDRPFVVEKIKRLIAEGVYPEKIRG